MSCPSRANGYPRIADDGCMAVERGTPGKSLIKKTFRSVLGVVTGEDTTADVKAGLKAYHGESRVARALRGLPSAWRLFHEVDIGGEQVDNVVAGPRGVFNIEVGNFSGTVAVTPRGLYTHGRRNNAPIHQALRQAAQLEELLEVEVQPVLVIVGTEPAGDSVDGVPVVSLAALLPFLLADTGLQLEWDRAKRVLATLEARTR